MKVIQIPVYPGNPYHLFLAQALTKYGVQVELVERFSPLFPLSKIVQSKQVDIIHLHWHHPLVFSERGCLRTVAKFFFFLADLVHIKRKGHRLVWTLHNKHHHENLYPIIDLLSAKALFRFADAIEVKGEAAKKFALRRFKLRSERIHVIPHGNYIDLYKNIESGRCRSELGVGQDSVVFLYLGQIRPYKGVKELIEAFKLLKTLNTSLVIAGKVRDTAFEKQLMNDARRFPQIHLLLRFIELDEMNVLFSASDVFVTPYRDILTSGSIVLGMSFSKPIIAPIIGCIPEYLPKDSNFLYSPNTVDSLAKALAQASKMDRQSLREMGYKNFLKAKNDLNWEKIAEKTISMYKEIL